MPRKHTAAVVVAAGRSQRMGFDKLFYRLGGIEVLRRTVELLDAHPGIHSLVVAAGENLGEVRALFEAHPTKKPLAIVPGGKVRIQSVANGVAACPDADYVAIHDAARPFAGEALITRTLEAAYETGAAAPALPVRDTAKRAQNGLITDTVDRNGLYAVQTPQIFERAAYLDALAATPEADYPQITDDCMVMERAHRPVRLVEGEADNLKITTPQDLEVAERLLGAAAPPALRVGHGYDVHRLAEGRKLILGGVEIPHSLGLLGHSDADVLLHAVADAVLGAAGLGDIGRHFPDTDLAYKDADSLKLLRQVAKLAAAEGWQAQNVDATLLCQKPKLAPHIPAMRANIAGALGLKEAAVNVKATTEEGLGFTGSEQGIAAHCVVMVGWVRA